MNLFLLTKIFYGIYVVNWLVSETQSANIWVSNKAKKDKECGKTEDDPCRTINAAVQIAKENSQIMIIASEEKYDDCPIYITKPLAFKGIRGKPIIDCDGPVKKDAFIFNLDPRAKEIKEQSVIKLDVGNMKIQNTKTGFSFLKPNSNVNLRLENITFENNEIDVSWSKSPLCYLVMTNVVAFGRSGQAVKIEGCRKATLKFINTKFDGKYFKVVSTEKSYILNIDMEGVVFDMSNRTRQVRPSDSAQGDEFDSPMQIVTAVNRTTLNVETSGFFNHLGDRNAMINITAFIKKIKYKKGKSKKVNSNTKSYVNINFKKTMFRNNTSLNGFGGAMWFNLTNLPTVKSRPYAQFEGCLFTDNSAASGGVAWFSKWYKKIVRFKDCTFKTNKAIGKDDGKDGSKDVGSGGALFALSGKFYIVNSVFVDNTAVKSGGSLCLVNKKFASMAITDSVFQNKQRSWSSTEGDVMYFDDVQTIFYGKVVFNLSSGNSGESMLLYEGRPSVLRMSNTSVFICPRGYNYEESRYTLKTKRTRPNFFPAYHIFAFSCKPCQDLFYSTTRGSRQANGTEIRGTCHACPYGASCNGTIRARANFWGRVKGDVVEMTPCPKGYCCKEEPCGSYDSCHSHRTGTLCGHCRDGYSEGMSSTECYPNSTCDGAVWLWPFFNVVVIFIFLCFHQEIINKVVKWSLWKVEREEVVEYRAEERNRNTINTEETESRGLLSDNATSGLSLQSLDAPDYTSIEESSEYNHSGGYIKVFFYFYQAILLIRLSSYVSGSSTPNQIIDLLTPLLNFQFTNIWSCGRKDMRPVSKVFVKNIVAYCVLGLSIVVYVIYRFLRCYLKRNIDTEPGFQARSFPVRLIGTVMHVILLSYVAQTQFTVQLLNCVNVGGEKVLYIDGSVVCYQTYQIFVWLYFGVCILPFPFALSVGQHLLASGRITCKEFLLACFLPLFFFVRWGFKYFKHRQGTETWTQAYDSRDPYKDKLLYILQFPYNPSELPNDPSLIERCGKNWESFLMFRRLVLVLVFIFVDSFLLRAYLFFIVSILILLAHVFVQPFVNKNVNKLDNVSLSLIVLISGLSISEATYNNAGQLVPSSVKTLQELQEYFLAFLPFSLLVVFLAPRAKQFYHWLCRGTRHRSIPIPTEGEMIVANPQTVNVTLSNEFEELT